MKTITKISAVAALLAVPLAVSAQMNMQTDQQMDQQSGQQMTQPMDQQTGQPMYQQTDQQTSTQMSPQMNMNAQMATSSNDSLSRGQVYQDLEQVRQAGDNTGVGDQPSYPRQIQAAEARVGAMEVSQSGESQYGYGGVPVGTSESGGPADEQIVQPAHVGNGAGQKPVYFGQ